MSREVLLLVAAMVTTAIGVCTLVGLGVRFVLVPYLEKHFKPQLDRAASNSDVVLDQVQNTHSTNLRHDIDDVRDTGLQTAKDVSEIKGILLATREQDAETHRDLWVAINELRRRDL